MSGFYPAVHVIVLVDSVGLRRGFLRILRFGPVKIVTFTLSKRMNGQRLGTLKKMKQCSFETVDSAKLNKENVR